MKAFRKSLNIHRHNEGYKLRQQHATEVAKGNAYLPRGITYYDIDKSFFEFTQNTLALTIDGDKVPVIKIIGIQKWAEFAKTWQYQDEENKYREIKLPFITVVRKLDPQPGTNQAGLWNVAGKPVYSYYKVPTTNTGRVGMDLYKIPQPTAVDLTYEIRLFCNSILQLNDFNQLIQKTFVARQVYLNPCGAYMPVVLDSIGDESNVEDLENRRYYTQLYELRLQGFILDENDFVVTPAIERVMLTTEITENKCGYIVRAHPCQANSTIGINIIIKPYGETAFSITSQYDIDVLNVQLLEYINAVSIAVNGVTKTTPFSIKQGDIVTFTVDKPFWLLGKFTISGNLT